jgi:hypothetical protein
MARERINLLLGVCSAGGDAEPRTAGRNGGWSNNADYESMVLELCTDSHYTLRRADDHWKNMRRRRALKAMFGEKFAQG